MKINEKHLNFYKQGESNLSSSSWISVCSCSNMRLNHPGKSELLNISPLLDDSLLGTFSVRIAFQTTLFINPIRDERDVGNWQLNIDPNSKSCRGGWYSGEFHSCYVLVRELLSFIIPRTVCLQVVPHPPGVGSLEGDQDPVRASLPGPDHFWGPQGSADRHQAAGL